MYFYPSHVVPKSTFTLFSSLAPELRLKIWQYACSERTISLRYIPEEDRCISSAKPPAVLQACHESRTETLRIYTLSYGTHSSPARIYFNPQLDTLYLPRHRQMGYDDTLRDFRHLLNNDKVLDEVKFVAIDHVDIEIKRPWEAYNKVALLRSLSKLKEVVLVVGGGKNVGLGEEEQFVEPKQDPEHSLRIWASFRQSVAMEEKSIEEGCTSMEMEYVRWQSPPIRIRSKGLRRVVN